MALQATKIIVHHTASSEDTTVSEIDAWHKERGFKCIGYHWVIRRLWKDGPWTIETGRHDTEPGAHCKGENQDSIGIAVCGNFVETDVPLRVVRLLGMLKAHYNLPMFPHKKFSTTECPGRLELFL